MATLADLKADIADDFARTDLTDAISKAVDRAILHYQNTRFFFNESRELTFSTVAGKLSYTATDDADIGLIIKIDMMHLTTGGRRREMRRITQEEWEVLTDNGAATGEPYCYSYFNETVNVYPNPDAAYTVRIVGHVKVDATATDNPWTNEAYDLVRARAIADVATHKIRDYDYARTMMAFEADQLDMLARATTKRRATGLIQATDF